MFQLLFLLDLTEEEMEGVRREGGTIERGWRKGEKQGRKSIKKKNRCSRGSVGEKWGKKERERRE